jgi:uncharacterized protein YqgQ
MIVTITISALAILVVILGFTTYNLLRKNEKQEDIVAGYLVYLDNLSRTIEVSEKKLKELDRGGVFEKDDEVGVIFQSILKIQEILNDFNLRKINN